MQSLIDKGIDFIASEQAKNGGFLSLSSAKPEDFSSASKLHSVFLTTFILSCLANLPETEKIKKVKAKSAKFLLSQKSKFWSFNYWVRGSKESEIMPYPDDLDDTFCALSAINEYDPEVIGGDVLACATQMLTALEQKEGGPYKTWLVSEDGGNIWKDVDLAVNSNIGFFLSQQGVFLDSLTGLVEKAVRKKNYKSAYYPSFYPTIFFISRFYKGKLGSKLVDFLIRRRKKDASWGNPMDTSLAVLSLLNLGVKASRVSKSVDFLKKEAKKGYKPHPFCFDPSVKGVKHYAGSSTLTAAFVIDALVKYFSLIQKPKQEIIPTFGRQVARRIYQNVKKYFLTLDTDLKEEALQALSKIEKINENREISLTPYFFALSLGKIGKKVKRNLLVSLGEANIYGWIAYTLYDNFLDDEIDSKTLPVANICLRKLSLIFADILPKKTGFYGLFNKIMDSLEAANTWEVKNCRNIKKPVDFKDYQKLADRSLGHALGPLAILFSLSYKTNSIEVKGLLSFFKHYLIAKQLNDDAHDWERDLKKEQINAVGSLLLREFKQKRLNIPQLQKLFWLQVVKEVCEEILKNCKKARKEIRKIKIITDSSIFEKLLQRQENSIEKALTERQKTLSFLKKYS